MKIPEYDFIVIGTGPAGLSAALTAAKAQKKVLILEREGSLGGVCVNTGTFPSKTLREAVIHLTGHLTRKIFTADAACLFAETEISMDRLKQRLRDVRLKEYAIIEAQLSRDSVDLIRGTAAFEDSKTIRVRRLNGDEILVRGSFIIIATGSRPRTPAEIPFDREVIFDSTSILDMKTIPCSMLILGGGVIGSEYATIFAALGVKVTLLDTGPRLLKFLDYEISDYLKKNFPKGNIDYISNCGAFQISRENGRAGIRLDTGREFHADALLFGLGREANTVALDIQKAGIVCNQWSYIQVNDLYQTSVADIYAVGDVIGWPSLAATSITQGRLAACNALQKRADGFPHLFPVGIYTIPEISYVGITEEEARARGYKIVVGRCAYEELPRGQISGESEGLVKMIVHSDTREILGVHILGAGATEIIHIALLALFHNAKIDLFVNNIFNYPTYSEALKIAALSASDQIEAASGTRPV
ncbi:MAG: Si-specific NAD(P)(+) transhydrogenase [Desulfocapsaceae bacterium]|nr:Si-specific NAD(P)(+) transhydrogenase [Desulfocapsaceae bacterium]